MRSFKFFICLLLIFCLTFFAFSSCLAIESTYIWSDSFDIDASEVSANAVQDTTTTNSAGSSNATATENSIQESINTSTSNENSTNTNSLNLESESAILIEQTTGKVLYAHNEHEQLRPASVTKIMSILLIMEALDSGQISLTDAVPCSENAASMGGSQIWLDPTETLTVNEMLKAICVASANDRSCSNGRIHCWL